MFRCCCSSIPPFIRAAAGVAAVALAATVPVSAQTAGRASPRHATPGHSPGDTLPISTVPLGPFPYFRWPAEFVPQNTAVDESVGHFLFWTGQDLREVEGRTYLVTLVAADDRGTFNEYLIRKTIEGNLVRLGGVRVAAGRLPSRVIGTISDVDKQSLGAGLGDIWNDPVQTWRIRRADRDIWVHYTDDSARASLAVVETPAR